VAPGAPYRDTVRALADVLALGGADRAAFEAAASRPRGRATARSEPASLIAELPAPLTPLIGREREVAEAVRLLRRIELRLLALTGAGGIGKTRVSLGVAAELLGDFTDGVAFVALASVGDPELVLPSIAQALGLPEAPTRPLAEHLAEALREKHLLPAAPAIAALLERCLRLKVLVTSRAVLRLSGERELPVPPLALPEQDRPQSPEELRRSAAVALFCQRAEAVQPAFELTSATAPVVAEIARRLDGLPLAIELAAARSKVLPPGALLERLNDRLSLLTSGARDLPTRQRTLRDAIAWSYDLLPATEQALFRRLAVFAGGCTLEAAEAVSDTGSERGLDVLDRLASLVDQSLLTESDGPDGEPRFGMLDTIREFGWEQLGARGERDDARQRHAAYVLSLAEEAAPALTSADRRAWMQRLTAELDNVRAALAWSVEQGDAEQGLRIVGAVGWWWYWYGPMREGRQWAETVLALPTAAAPTAWRARVLFAAVLLSYRAGDMAGARAQLEESVAVSRQVGDRRTLAFALTWAIDPDPSVVGARLAEGIALMEEIGERWGLGLAYFNRAAREAIWGNTAAARDGFESSLALFNEIGDRWAAAIPSEWLGQLQLRLGEYAQARSRLEESLAIFREVGDRSFVNQTVFWLGRVALEEHDAARAAASFAECLAGGRRTAAHPAGRGANVGRPAWSRRAGSGPPARRSSAAPSAAGPRPGGAPRSPSQRSRCTDPDP
jgi:predicted ATPase